MTLYLFTHSGVCALSSVVMVDGLLSACPTWRSSECATTGYALRLGGCQSSGRGCCENHNRKTTAGLNAKVRPAAGVWTTRDGSGPDLTRSEEHTAELQSLMRISYAGFCL